MKIFNNHLNMAILLGLLLPLTTLLYLAPVNALPACGTITTSTYNFAGCTGTLTIGASNINFGCKSGGTIIATGQSNGIVLSGVSNVNVFGCTVTGATMDGIYISGGSYNSLIGNNASFMENGFLVQSSFGNILAGNTATGNTEDGFWLLDSNNNTLASNKATSNTGGDTPGFDIENSNSNILSDNTATSNGLAGFEFSGNFNTVTDNTANTNYLIGFYFGSSTSGNAVFGNAAKGNGDSSPQADNAINVAGLANNFHTSLNPKIVAPYSGLQTP